MLNRVAGLTVLPGYCLRIEFDDGIAGIVELSGELHGEVFGPLRDEALFRQAHIDEYGAVVWPNGADLAPDGLHFEIAAREAQSGTLIAGRGSEG